MFGYSKEAVRVKVKKCEGKLQPELRKFSVDPQITSLEVLQSILVKAFDIKSDFTLSYRTFDDTGQEVYLPLLSDWELDAAFLKAHNIAVSQHSEPCVQLKVDMKPFAEASEDWEPPTMAPMPSMPVVNQNTKEQPTVYVAQQAEKSEAQTGFQELIMNQVEKTFNMVSKALNLYDDPNTPPRPPLNDIEFRAFLDAVGQITNKARLREVIYCGGIEPSLRKVVWKHILNVYPDGMTGKERMDYIKKKANEYYTLRACWKECIQKGKVNSDLAYVTSMVRKDVLRTDRHHTFYAGSDDNQNIASLFNILTTYALYHPTVSYCQGMSDLASPLLVTMGDEAHAYICLCALMTRLYPNFLLDGEAMTLKFSHLTESLQVYDPEFYNYLKSQQADDLLFCYRWLLLEMKREFAFDDALRMLEVLWASLPQKSSNMELSLKEKEFDPSVEVVVDPPPLSPLIKTPRENAYTKVCAMRRQSSSFSLANIKAPKLATIKQTNHSLDENAARKALNSASLKHVEKFQSLDDTMFHLKNCKENIGDKNKESVPVDAEIKKCVKNSMKSVPEHEKLPQSEETVSWSSTGNLVNGTSQADIKDRPLGSQIRMLRDKISIHNNRFFSSLDKLNDSTEADNPNKPKVKIIKNLNEFLNFATGSKPGHVKQEMLQRTHSAIERTRSKDCPKITLTKTSYEENDLSSQNLSNKRSFKLKSASSDTNDGSSPDDSQEYYPMTTSMTRELRLELEHLDRQVFGPSYINRCSMIYDSPSESTSTEEKPTNIGADVKQEDETLEVQPVITAPETLKKSPLFETIKSNARSAEDIYLWENPLHRNTPTTRTTASCPQTPDEQAELDFDGDTGEIIEEHSGKKSITPIRLLRKNNSLEPRDLSRDNKHSNERSNAHSSESDSSEREPADSVNTTTVKTKIDNTNNTKSHKFFSNMSQELENAKKNCESLLNVKQTNLHSVASTINNFQKKYEVLKPPVQKNASVTSAAGDSTTTRNSIGSLPSPALFGGGNPFLMYLCLTVLLQHRDYIMRNRMDYNELAMHFDKMVRKHNVNRVLNQARQMYAIYLKQQAHKTGDITT